MFLNIAKCLGVFSKICVLATKIRGFPVNRFGLGVNADLPWNTYRIEWSQKHWMVEVTSDVWVHMFQPLLKKEQQNRVPRTTSGQLLMTSRRFKLDIRKNFFSESSSIGTGCPGR